jgi:sulfide:quinone oxidoreductase
MALPELKQLGEQVWTSPQIQAEDFAEIASKGFRTVINNRPDHEAPDQPLSDELRAAAAKAGITYDYLPVVASTITPQQVDAFAKQLQELPKPILTFCRTGNRCSIMWSLVQPQSAV